MDDRAVACWRMHSMGLAGRPYPSAAAVVEGLLGVQAENHAQALWAVAARTPGVTEPDLSRQFDDGVFLRTHVLRPTWHYVRPDDIRWLVELTAPRVCRTFTQLQRTLGIDDAMLERAAEVIFAALSQGVHLTRAEVGERLAAEGLPGQGQALGVLMASAELSALVCSGRMRGRDHTYALLADRAPNARRLERGEAVAELVLRYFTGHGPATERDLAYWATMPLRDVRAGLAAVGDQLQRAHHGGRTYWYGHPPPAGGGPGHQTEPRAHLLQTLDEYHNGYQESRMLLDADGIVPRGRAAAVGMTLVEGQMVGDMRRSLRAGEVVFQVGLFRDLDAVELHDVDAAGGRYGRFLGLDARVVVGDAARA